MEYIPASSLTTRRSSAGVPRAGAHLLRRKRARLSCAECVVHTAMHRSLFSHEARARLDLIGNVLLFRQMRHERDANAHLVLAVSAVRVAIFAQRALVLSGHADGSLRPRALVAGLARVRVTFESAEECDVWARALRAACDRRSPRGDGDEGADFVQHVVRRVGAGAGGEVFQVRGTRGFYALKRVHKTGAFQSEGTLRRALDERLVLELMRGFPFVTQLVSAFQTEEDLCLVMEYCEKGDFKEYLSAQEGGRMGESALCKRIMAEIVLAVQFLHEKAVVLRDLKPENVLLTPDLHVKLCDFGLAKVLTTGRAGRTNSFCGSPSYMSPQVLAGVSYGVETDLWSIGVLFYRMLVGCTPFADRRTNIVNRQNDELSLYRRIANDDVEYPGFLSEDATHMLSALLQKSDDKRCSIEQLKDMPFFDDIDWDLLLEKGYARLELERIDAYSSSECSDADHELSSTERATSTETRARNLSSFEKPTADGRRSLIAVATSAINSFARSKKQSQTRHFGANSVVGFEFSSESNGRCNAWNFHNCYVV